MATASSDGPAGDRVLPGNQEVGERDDPQSPATYGVNERRKDLDTDLAIQRPPSWPRMIDPERRRAHRWIEVDGRDSRCWLNSKTHNTIG